MSAKLSTISILRKLKPIFKQVKIVIRQILEKIKGEISPISILIHCFQSATVHSWPGKEWILKGNSNHCSEIGVHNWKVLILLNLIQPTSESKNVLKIMLLFNKKDRQLRSWEPLWLHYQHKKKCADQIRGLIQSETPVRSLEMTEFSRCTLCVSHVHKNLKINVNPEKHGGVRVCLLQTLVRRPDSHGKDKNSFCDSGNLCLVLI